MTPIEFLVLLIVAGVAGALGQAIAGRSLGGFIISIVLGFVGAYLGRWLADSMDLPALYTIQVGDKDFPIVWSIIGAALFVIVVSFLTRGKRRTT